MAKVTETRNFCDRCGKEFKRQNAFIVEDMNFTASGYDDRGSGGTTVKGKEFCSSCSKQFWDWLNTKPPKAEAQP